MIDTHSVDWLRGKLSVGKGGAGVSYRDKILRYHKKLKYDLIETPFDGLNSKEQLDAAANVREAAKVLDENIETLLALMEMEPVE